MKKAFVLLCSAALILPLSGCNDPDNPIGKVAHGDPVDQPLDLTHDDYRHLAQPKGGPDAGVTVKYENHAPTVPELAPILATPRPPKIGETRLVSLTVTDDVPLKDVLLELAKLADVDVELDAGITGGISFIAKKKPFNDVIERICNLADLRYNMKNGVLRIERDIPYVRSYSLDFLNVDRSSSSTVNVSTNVLSSGGGGDSSSSSSSSSGGSSSGGSSGGLNTGSTSSVSSKTDADFWKSLDDGIKNILGYSPPKRVSDISGLLDSNDVISSLTGASQATAVPNAAPVDGAPNSAPNGAPRAAAAPAVAPPAAPVTPAAAAGEATNGNADLKASQRFYSINRQAGTLTVSASEKQHDMIRAFLDKLNANASSQVLIEAKILEVSLRDQYKTGIEWDQVGKHFGFTFKANNFDSTATNVVSFIVDDSVGFNTLVKLTEEFGTVRTLSSPRLNAINNQVATLTFARNEVYFDLSVETNTTSSTSTTTQTTVESTAHTVPIGIIMSIQPSINTESNEVTLNVRPTLSALVGKVEDPAVAYLAQTSNVDIKSEIPIVQVRELDSILKIKSGQAMVIGGLMQQGSTNTDVGMPGVSSLPVIGNLFKGVTKDSSTSELIIFVKATIIGSNGYTDPADRVIYNKFSDDPRPATF